MGAGASVGAGVYRVVSSRPGVIELSDGSKLILRVVVVGVGYAGFSPFGGSTS